MSSKRDILREVHGKVPDVTESVVVQVIRKCDYDKQKVLDWFGNSNLASNQRNASFDQTVQFLREAVPIEGAPISLYENCVRKADGDASRAFNLVEEEYKKMKEDEKEEKKMTKDEELHRAHEPAPSSKPVPVESPLQEQPHPRHVGMRDNRIFDMKKRGLEVVARINALKKKASEEKQPIGKPQKPLPTLPSPKVEETPAVAPPAEVKVEEKNSVVDQLEEQQKKTETIISRIEALAEKPDAAAEADILQLEDELHRCDVHVSCIESVVVVDVPPDYKKGRLPTDACEIKVEQIENMEVTFTWKIADSVEVSAKDWIGLYIHDRQFSNKYEDYIYLGGKKEGSSKFKAPGNGFFDLRYYQNGGSVEKSRSEPFLVGPEMKVKAVLNGRRKIDVTTVGQTTTDGDWMGLYPVSTFSNAKYLQYIYAKYASSEGIVTFDAPRQPGEYEVRYFYSRSKVGTGYAFSGRSDPIVIPNEDEIEVIATHPVVRVRWQTFSQVPNSSDWVGLYDSSDDKANRLGWEYLSKKGLEDSVGDHGVAEIEVKELKCLAEEGALPEGSDKWEVRLFNSAPNQPFLRAPFLSK